MRFFISFLLCSASLLAADVAPTAKPTPPNVLLIVGDDWGYTDFGFMGHATIKTPHLDRLAKEGCLYKAGYVPTSLCRASLASILTGRYPHECLVFYNDPPSGSKRDADFDTPIKDQPTIPRLLQSAGYRSFQTGKLWDGHYRNAGFTAGMTTKGRHGEEGLDIGRKTLEPIFDFLKGGTQPFFLWYAPMLPHTPHNPPEKYLANYRSAERSLDVAKYMAMCEWTDATIGDLLTRMKTEGYLKNTLVIFLNDNGWRQLPNPTREKLTDARAKLTPYEMGLRTPILFWMPDQIKPAVIDTPIASVDLLPTIVKRTSATVPSTARGIDLWPAITSQEKTPERDIYGELYEHGARDIAKPTASLLSRYIRSGNWKLIAPKEASQPAELYDLSSDPDEKTNLATKEPARVTELTQKLDQWWKIGE